MMKKFPTWLLALLLTPVLIIGALNLVAPEVSEEIAFVPQPRAIKAKTQADLENFWLANAKATNWKTPMLVTSPRAGVTRLMPKDRGTATFLAQDTSHGFLDIQGGRIAYSLTGLADKSVDPARPLIVMCGGNSMDRYSAGVSYAQKGLPWGDVMMFDYPGYGDSTGTPTPPALEAAIKAVVVKARAVSAGRPIIFWGHSLGGFVCGKLASQVPETKALILETTARNAKEVVREWTPPWMRLVVFPKISPSLARYDNARAIGGAKFPVLVLGAGQDKTLPVGLSRSLATALKEANVVVSYHEFAQAEHWNVPNQRDFRKVADTFFASLR
jgi:pimeloyl-ACP methyl ester carboxylesterase